MDDYIRRKTVLDAAELVISRDTSGKNAVVNAMIAWSEYIKGLPSEDVQPVRHDPCDVCDELEDGDTLYIHSEWDGGIGFDYIHDIHFCPKCGRRLQNFEWEGGEQND